MGDVFWCCATVNAGTFDKNKGAGPMIILSTSIQFTVKWLRSGIAFHRLSIARRNVWPGGLVIVCASDQDPSGCYTSESWNVNNNAQTQCTMHRGPEPPPSSVGMVNPLANMSLKLATRSYINISVTWTQFLTFFRENIRSSWYAISIGLLKKISMAIIK